MSLANADATAVIRGAGNSNLVALNAIQDAEDAEGHEEGEFHGAMLHRARAPGHPQLQVPVSGLLGTE